MKLRVARRLAFAAAGLALSCQQKPAIVGENCDRTSVREEVNSEIAKKEGLLEDMRDNKIKQMDLEIEIRSSGEVANVTARCDGIECTGSEIRKLRGLKTKSNCDMVLVSSLTTQ